MNTIERLKELEAKATKSWRVCDEQSWKIYDDPQSIVADISAKNDWSHGMTMNCIHASLIAEMRNALPKLLAVVEAAKVGSFHHNTCPWLNGGECFCAKKLVDEALNELEK